VGGEKITREDLAWYRRRRLKVIPLITGGRDRQIIAGPTANPIIAGLMVSPVARAASAADPASQSAGLYRERNIPEHPRIVEAIIWSNARRALHGTE